MKKINLDLSKAVEENDILSFREKVSNIHLGLEEKTLVGSDFLGWKDLPKNHDKNEVKEIKKAAQFLFENKVEVLVVIGIGGSYLGARAAIDAIQGLYPLKEERKMQVIFAGNSISSSYLYQLIEYLKDKKFAINVVSKSGTTTEPAIAFRILKSLLEEKVGKDQARKLIFATTDKNRGALHTISVNEGYQRFVIADDIGGRFSVLSAVGLFPMACAGINIDNVLLGAQKANEVYGQNNLIDNDAYRYAVARYILGKKYPTEMLVSYEPNYAFFNEWWKQLFGESEGKEEKGILPTSAIFSTDLHSLGQFIQEGSKILFETVLTVKNVPHDIEILKDAENLDELNYLSGKTLHYVNNAAFKATQAAHVNEGKVPNIHIELEDSKEETFGWLVMLFERACAISAHLLGVNPFNQPGVEVYKNNMFKILGKPTK
ncbi:glucose-6-phosphate isomerase [Mycoplasma iguanae]|uniref:Glucose-6-phosphate isomerase n=1 Tax=Mycoplasma iguanae TaxID=292461 RepID=A0ABY5R8P4_9MOLU|nr:glucose-6-phosphate isomerase [Mycoplasma iguanae]UVD81686.1 glucose-6-phosphate isomerase [Mycoplasma iguanae]